MMSGRAFTSALFRLPSQPILPKLLFVTAAFIDSAIVLSAIISWNNEAKKIRKRLGIKGELQKCDKAGQTRASCYVAIESREYNMPSAHLIQRL